MLGLLKSFFANSSEEDSQITSPANRPIDGPTLQEALIVRPSYLGEIEPNLMAPTPRSDIWFYRDGRKCSDNRDLTYGQPVRGWVCLVKEVESASPDPGPDYHIWFAYELEGQTIIRHKVVSYDVVHWAGGEPESYGWFKTSIVESSTITILLDPENLEPVIFGLLDPYVMPVDACGKADSSPVWAAQPGVPMDWSEYFSKWLSAIGKDLTATQLCLDAARRRLTLNVREDWNWFLQALAEPQGRKFVAAVFEKKKASIWVRDALLLAAIIDTDPEMARGLILPCIDAFGAVKVRRIISTYQKSGSDEEKSGATRSLSWINENYPLADFELDN